MRVVLTLIGALVANLFKSPHRLEVENLFLRHQLSIALGAVGMADLVLAKPARFVPRGSAGDDPAVASRWVSGLLALEIPRSTGPAESQP